MNPLAQMMGTTNNFASVLKMMQGKDPNAVMQLMAQRNPKFKQFWEHCQGKTPEQVAQEYGIDLNAVKQILK